MTFSIADLRLPSAELRWYDVEQPWRDVDRTRYTSTNCNACSVRPNRRGSNTDVTFLKTLQPLLGVELDRGPRNDDVVFELADLVCLILRNHGRASFDPRRLPNLAQLATDDRPDLERVAECPALKALTVWGWRTDDLSLVRHTGRVEYLRIEGRGQEFSLDGVEGPDDLQVCWIDSMTPRSLAGLETQRGLRYLYISSPVRGVKHTLHLEPLRALVELAWINLQRCGHIASLEPLRGLPSLQGVSLGATIVVDGDMRPLIGLPPGVNVSFADMPHYSHTLEQVQRARGAEG